MKYNKLIFNAIVILFLSIVYSSCCLKPKEKGTSKLSEEAKLYIPYVGTEYLDFRGTDGSFVLNPIYKNTDFQKKYTSDKLCDYYNVETKVLQFSTTGEKKNQLIIEFFLAAASSPDGTNQPYFCINIYSQEYYADKYPDLSQVYTSSFWLGDNLTNPCATQSDKFKCNQTITFNGLTYGDVYVITDKYIESTNKSFKARTIYYTKMNGVIRIEMANGLIYDQP